MRGDGGPSGDGRGRHHRVEAAIAVVVVGALAWMAVNVARAADDAAPGGSASDSVVSAGEPMVTVWHATATLPFEETGRRVTLDPSVITGPADVRVELTTPSAPRTWRGVGAALTDASASLLAGNPTGLDLLFDPTAPGGAALDIVRLPLSATDFSTRPWTWEPGADPPVESELALGVLDDIVQRRPDLDVIGAAWTAPPELRSDPAAPGGHLVDVDGYGRLLIDQVDALRDRGVPLSAISLGNEPGVVIDAPSLVMTDDQLLELAAVVGPALDRSGVQLMALDHNWADARRAATLVAGGHFDAVAFHCYDGDPSQMAGFELSTLVTECTATTGPWHSSVGWMARELVGDAVRAGSTGLVMWNLALDPDHGPKGPGGCDDCRGLLTIDGAATEPTPEFRVLAHLSAAADPGATILDTTRVDRLPMAAFVNPDGSIGIFGHNDRPEAVSVRLQLDGEQLVDVEVPSWAVFSLRS